MSSVNYELLATSRRNYLAPNLFVAFCRISSGLLIFAVSPLSIIVSYWFLCSLFLHVFLFLVRTHLDAYQMLQLANIFGGFIVKVDGGYMVAGSILRRAFMRI